MLAVIRISVRISQGDEFLFAPVEIEAINFILNFVTNVEKACWVPNRTFGETESGSNSRELSVTINQLPELRRFCLQLEASGGHVGLEGKEQETSDQDNEEAAME